MVYCNSLKNNYLKLARYTVLGASFRRIAALDKVAYSFSFATFIILRYSLLYSKQYFEYPHPSVISDSKGFTVKGNVKAIYQPSSSSSNQSSSNRTTTDTIGAFMIPTERWTNIFHSSRFDVSI